MGYKIKTTCDLNHVFSSHIMVASYSTGSHDQLLHIFAYIAWRCINI